MSSRTTKSIYDLAGETGVPAVAVSRVLNGREGVGEATRLRVLAAVRETVTRKRVRSRRPIVAVVVDRDDSWRHSQFGAAQLSHLIATLTAHEFAVELFTERTISRLADAAVEGVLLAVSEMSTAKRLRDVAPLPVVSFNRPDVAWASSVTVDYREQGELALNHLFERGHRGMAILCEARKSWSGRERTAGFVSAARACGLKADDVAALYTDHQPMYGVLRHLLEERNPTAIFFAGEDMLPEGTYILRDLLGKEVPDDISVIGMESGRATQFHSPAITAVVEPTGELARKAVELLVSHIVSDETKERTQTVLSSRLIERESVLARH